MSTGSSPSAMDWTVIRKIASVKAARAASKKKRLPCVQADPQHCRNSDAHARENRADKQVGRTLHPVSEPGTHCAEGPGCQHQPRDEQAAERGRRVQHLD